MNWKIKKLWLLKKILKILILLVFLGIIIVLLINYRINAFSKDKIYEVKNAPEASVAILLGAGVLSDKSLSDVLRDRALTAVELWETHKIQKILVSGDNASIYYNEVVPVQKFLIEQGVPKEIIFLDYAGFDTYDSVYRAKNIFLVQDALIISQKFHLPRSVYLCEKVGIKCAGVIADRQSYVKESYFEGREILANVKAFFDILLDSSPHFLGETIDINVDM